MTRRRLSSERARALGRKGGRASAQRRATVDLARYSILDAMDAPELFGEHFQGGTWSAWRAFLAGVFALPTSEAEREAFVRFTGREPPERPVSEAWAIVGRRGGKSRIAALCAVYLATCRTYRLAPGERGTVLVLASDRKQARVVFRYIVALLDGTPALRRLVQVRRKESLDLANGVTVEIHTASYRAVRGYSIVAAVCDEVAFWRDETTANPDREVLDALRPGMATVPGSLLLCISTPYAQRGELYRAFERYYGEPGPVLVWQADTRAMNPGVSAGLIERAYVEDPTAAAAEYGAEFRRDVEAFLAADALGAVTVPDRFELAPGERTPYVAFADPSGGSRDSFTLAIAHLEDETAVLDCVREVRPPFSPDAVCEEFAGVLTRYGLREVTGDRYAGEWPRERFAAHGIAYRVATMTKSDIYKALLPAVNSGRVALLDLRTLRAQLEGLERRTAHGGRDSIDHPPGGRDDVANAAAGALVLAASLAGPAWEDVIEWDEVPGGGFLL